MAAERLGTGWLQLDVRCLAFNDLMKNVIIMDLMAIRIAAINIGGPFSIAEYSPARQIGSTGCGRYPYRG